MSDDFEKKITKYFMIDNKIKQLQAKLKVLRNEKKMYEIYVTNYVKELDADEIEFENEELKIKSKLKINKSTTRKKADLNLMKECLEKRLNNPLLVNEIMDDVENNRVPITKEKLKRTDKK